jgi:hypothetical protein
METMSTDLAALVTEIERHLAESGWDQPPRLYALVNTGDLRASEPNLADMLADSDPDGLTPVEQDPIEGEVADLLPRIEWPDAVLGAAVVDEVLMLPDGAVADRPEGTDEVEWAQRHPDQRDVRIVVGVLRSGERAGTIRIRGADAEEDQVLSAPDLIPNLAVALLETFDTDPEPSGGEAGAE